MHAQCKRERIPKDITGVYEVLVGMNHTKPLGKAMPVSFDCLLVLILSFPRQQRVELLTLGIKVFMDFN